MSSSEALYFRLRFEKPAGDMQAIYIHPKLDGRPLSQQLNVVLFFEIRRKVLFPSWRNSWIGLVTVGSFGVQLIIAGEWKPMSMRTDAY